MKEKFFTWFPVVTGASESKLRRRERGTERVQTERVRELRPREFQLLRQRELRPREQSFSFWNRESWERESWERDRVFLSGGETYLLHFFSLSGSNVWARTRLFRGSGRGKVRWTWGANMKCNSSLGETSSNWNSSLEETRRLFSKKVFKQCFLAK